VEVQSRFRLSGEVLGFDVGHYDRDLPLFIDPTLSYSTYLGGGGSDKATAVAVDSFHNAYLTGFTDSLDFPATTGALRTTTGGGNDAFVVKLNATGTAVLWATYLGGSGDDRGFSIAVDGAGSAYVAGWTQSANFPTKTPKQASSGGGRDAFVAKLSPNGASLVYSTYLGGAGSDTANGIAIDSSGNAYITGSATSPNFPIVGGVQGTNRGQTDAIIAKLVPAGNALAYSTYLGGAGDDRGAAIAIDSAGNAYITGTTSSNNFTTVTPVQAALAGQQDAFAAKLNAAGSALAYSTYLGGTKDEYVEVGASIAVDASSSAYIVGTTTSADFPTASAMQSSLRGVYDAFAAKLSTAGTALVYSTYIGGASVDYANAVAVDSSGNAHVVGYTNSFDFPISGSEQPTPAGNYDAFLAKLNATGSTIGEGAFLGGTGSDTGFGIALDTAGGAYVVGQTMSSNFPLKDPIQTSNNGNLAAFAAKFAFTTVELPQGVSVTPSSGTGYTQSFTLTYSHSAGYASIKTADVLFNATATTSSACYVRYDRTLNALQLASDTGSGWVGSITPATAGTLQNTQCSLNAAGSSASGTGATLTVVVALTFKAAFPGAKNTYIQATNNADLSAGWLMRGGWTVPANNNPALVSVTPATGSGSSQSFSFVFSDGNGFADLATAEMNFNTSTAVSSACYIRYTRATNSIELASDAGNTWLGPLVLGAAGSLTNTQCGVDAALSSAIGAVNDLTVNLSILFKAVFAGGKSVYMQATDSGNVTTAWQAKGAWTVTAGGPLPPVNLSVTAPSGSGSTQTFTYVFTDPYGNADLKWAWFNINTSNLAANSCYARYTRATNVVELATDNAAGWVGSAVVGAAGKLINTQCMIDAGLSTVVASGDTLTLNISTVFKPAYAGAKNIYMQSMSNTSVVAGFQYKGSFTALADGTLPPMNVSVTPSSGSGSAQTFSFLYSDPYGYGDLQSIWLNINTSSSSVGGCYVRFTRSTNVMELANDAGTGWIGSAVIGQTGKLQNSQCSIDAGLSTVVGSGENLTLNLSMIFRSAFAGVKYIYMQSMNNTGTLGPFQYKGAYTVLAGGSLTPSNVSATPSSGSGSYKNFSFLYSDPYGAADLKWLWINIHSTNTSVGACYGRYTRATNAFELANDAGTGWLAPIYPGTAGKATNSQCSVDGAQSSVVASGDNLTMNLYIIFRPVFAGARNIYMQSMSNSSVVADFTYKGAWTVTADGALKPANTSVTPSSGSGSSPAFSFLYTDPYGFADLKWVWGTVGSTAGSANACYFRYTRATNVFELANNTGSDWAGSGTVGSAVTLQNSQCSVNLASVAVVGSGDTLTVSVPMVFKTGFTGSKNLFMQSMNNFNNVADFQWRGSWTIP
ncbi:MAG: SBBP repeat-containing protein, partial [Bryobacteraceae bacterium]